MVKSKNDAPITTHLPQAYLQAIQEEALRLGITPSQWLRDVAVEKLNHEYLQAKNKANSLKIIENDDLYQIFESRQRYKGYQSDE